MKVLHVIQRFAPAIGGSEKWCENIAEFCAQQGIVSEVATTDFYDLSSAWRGLVPGESPAALGSFERKNNLTIRRYPQWSLTGPRISSRIARALLKVPGVAGNPVAEMFRISPHSFALYSGLSFRIRMSDVVHLHTLPYFHNLVGYWLARLYGKKVVITPHFHPGHRHYETPPNYFLLRRADAVIAVSDYERDFLTQKGVPYDRIVVTGNAIADVSAIDLIQIKKEAAKLTSSFDVPSNGRKILFLGRKELYKGIGLLSEVLQELVQEDHCSDICLILAGPDSEEYRCWYADVFRKQSWKFPVIDLGIVTEAQKEAAISMSEVVVLPSAFEAFGIVFLEAWRFAKPVIGSDRGAVPQVIRGAGLTFKYPDRSSLKAALKTLLSDAVLAKRLGQHGRTKLEKEFSLETIGSKVSRTYRKLYPKKKVLVVNHLWTSRGGGGAEVIAMEEVFDLKRRGYDVVVFTGQVGRSGKSYCCRRFLGGLEVISVNLGVRSRGSQGSREDQDKISSFFMRTLEEKAPDIVHFHNTHLFPSDVLRLPGIVSIPTVMTLHDYWGICSRRTLLAPGDRICADERTSCGDCSGHREMKERRSLMIDDFNKLDLLISPSRYLLDRFIRCGLETARTAVLPNAVRLFRSGPVRKTPSGKTRFVYIGGLYPHKGLVTLLQGFSRLYRKLKGAVTLMVVGDGDPDFSAYCRRLSDELGLQGAVRFDGYRENSRIPRIFAQADCLVLPSVWPENAPLTILESLASGTPVAATAVGGVPEIIEDGKEGYLFAPNSPVELSGALEKFAGTSAAERSKLQSACRKKAGVYRWESRMDALCSMYDRLLKI